ncbi:receptor expression-enhancing protein 1 isoform 2-T2 [Amazona ochrocephala]
MVSWIISRLVVFEEKRVFLCTCPTAFPVAVGGNTRRNPWKFLSAPGGNGASPRLIFGTLYPAYYSYKAVKSKDIKEYVKWMMYWIIFALFTTAETFTDIFLCWFPFYYELKIAFVAWLLSPYTKGSSLLYRKFVHPTLSSKEKEIDDCLVQAKDRSYDALVHFGKRGLNVAATAAVMAASKGQGALSERLRSFSMQDLSTIRGDSSSTVPPSVTVRTSSKQSHPKPSRSASEGTGSSVCTCCSVCRLLRGKRS